MNSTDSHGIVEEPSAKAQEEALKAAENATGAVVEDEVAANPTAEQGSAAEPSAEAQKAMLNEDA